MPYAVSERLKERDRLLDVLPRLVSFLPPDEELGELELDQEPEAFQVRRQVLAQRRQGAAGRLRSAIEPTPTAKHRTL